MNPVIRVAALATAFLTFRASALVNINLNDGSASFATAAAGVFGAPFDNPTLPDTNLYVDGSSSLDYLSKYCWYYRTIDSNKTGQTVPFSFAGQPTVTGSGNAQTAFWGTNTIASYAGVARFSGQLTMNMTRTGAGKLGATANMTITADPQNTSQQVFEIFCLLDPTVSIGVNNGLADNATLAINSDLDRTTFSNGSGRYVEFLGKDVTRYEVGATSTVKGRLATGANNLNVNTSVFGVDAAAAYQWTLVLNPGESRLLETAFSVNQPASLAVVPEPATVGLVGALLPLMRRNRRKI